MICRKSIISCFLLLVMVSLRAAESTKSVISILGDSYSTFEGYIPEGNTSWYATTAWENRTDVTDVRQ